MIIETAKAANRHGSVLALAASAVYGSNIVSAQIAAKAGLNGPLLVSLRQS